MQKIYKIKWHNIFIIIIIILLTIIFTINIIRIVKYLIESKKTKEQINTLQNIIIENNNVTSQNDEIIENEDVTLSPNPYLEYYNINVDFNELKNINSDTAGWIKINNTLINYPFVQTKNNNYYLNHDFLKNYNTGGWVFLDYRNNINNLSENNIIYGHNRKDKTMFGTLKNIYEDNWLNNKDNHFIELYTDNYQMLFQIFSIYHIKKTTDYLQTDFSSEDDFNNFINLITNRSLYKFGILVNNQDKILTLSTCYKNNERTVLHAKLVNKKILK